MNNQKFEQVPLDEKYFPRTCEVLQEALTQGVSPGFGVGVWKASEPHLLWSLAKGNRRSVPSPQVMEGTTLFDLSSLTKVFATAMLTAVLVERGWLSWDTPVAAVLPHFRHSEIRVSHLLSHTAGFSNCSPFWERLREEFNSKTLFEIPVYRRQEAMKALVLAENPVSGPGEKILYSDISFLLLGFLLESVVQTPLDEAVQRFVWNPMGITGASFRRVNCSASVGIDLNAAATEECPWRGAVLQGQVHDDNCWAMGGYGGHAGAFGGVLDLAQFIRSIFGGFLSASVVEQMWRPISGTLLPSDGNFRTLGWDMPSPQGSSSGSLFSKRSVGHLGFTGTSLWIDPEARLGVILLSNRVHPNRENILIRKFRPKFHDAVRLDLAI
ncbi:MAG: beta-lactamase family protein [Bdellovibrio sp.]|nr:beta-lactamase family protein [Bdellovibrio sp.]